MRRAPWIALATLLGLLGLVLLLMATVLVGLNTEAGRNFALREINRLAGPQVHVEGLAGHFPAAITLRRVTLRDSQGLWLDGQNLELRWQPLRLLHDTLDVTALTADELTVLRLPAAQSQSRKSGGFSLPVRVVLRHLEIGRLKLGAALAGEPVDLHVAAAARVDGPGRGSLIVNASTPDGRAQYHVDGAINPQTLKLEAHVSEPPEGLLGHYAGPEAQGPLSADIHLAGPEQNAALTFALALGAAKLDGQGRLGLAQPHAFADVMLNVPALAPFADMAKQTIHGSTRLHLQIAQARHDAVRLALDGEVALTQAPAEVQKLLGAKTTLAVHLLLHNGDITIDEATLRGAALTTTLSGVVGKRDLALETRTTIDPLSALANGVDGTITETSRMSGPRDDFTLATTLGGTVKLPGQPSEPFTIDLNVQHLPRAPAGTLAGHGKLANAPLLLDARFNRDEDGGFAAKIAGLKWRSATVTADLQLAPGKMLPTGTAAFSIGNLADFASLTTEPLHGALRGDFAYSAGESFKLDLAAKNLLVSPMLGAVNGTVSAIGPLQALAVKLQLALADLQGQPAQLSATAVVDGLTRAANVTQLHGAWHGLQLALLGPAAVETQPAMAIRHLALGLNGARVTLNGTVWPKLDATAAVTNLPLSLADHFMPQLGAEGMVGLEAALRGSPLQPNGKITLTATGLHLTTGPAAALPPAEIKGQATLAGKTAAVDLALDAGRQIGLELSGKAPLTMDGAMDLRATGRMDVRLLNLILAASGTEVRGVLTTDLTVTGTAKAPLANGTVVLRDGSVQNIGSGLSLTAIDTTIAAQGQNLVLQNFTAAAGQGTLAAHGHFGLEGDMPVDLTLTADNASPVVSDLVTEALDGKVTLTGAVKTAVALAGEIDITKANINIPHGLPPSVVNLPVLNEGETPPPPPAPPPRIALDLLLRARSHIFIRGDGLFAELAGHIKLGGTLADPIPRGRFTLVRGNLNLAGKSLQFTSGDIGFAGGFTPTLNLVATASSAQVSAATLTVGGTAAKPTITLSSSPPLPSDEILAQLLFGESSSSLTPFQAASLAAALAQISGVGGGLSNPLDKVRNALGLDELSVGGTGSGPPTLQAGRYVAPGVYVGATQSTGGQSTSVNVQVNLYKGLKLDTSTGTSATSGDSSSVGLSYQFNY